MPDTREKTIDYLLRTTWIAVAKMYQDQAAKKGSSMATGFALISIDPEKGTPSTALGPRMGMEATSLSRTLKTMEEKNLIERRRNPDDGRGMLVHLTEFGREMREYSKSIVLQFDQSVQEVIPEEDLATFIRVAQKINDLVLSNKIYK